MKTNEDKNIEKLINYIMKGSTLESPTSDFTSKIMLQVLETKTSDATIYKPLISTTTFIKIFGSIALMLIFLFSNGETQTSSWLSNLNFSPFYNNNLLSGFNFSKVTTYSVLLTTLMFLIQITLLKNHFDKQLEK